MTEYTERGSRWRRRRKGRRYNDHKMSASTYYDLLEKDARDLGRISPLADWRRNTFARNMFELIADERTLKAAYDSGHGNAAGLDGVRRDELWRAYVYRKWAEACRLYGHKRPRFSDTVFPDAPAWQVSALLLACDPQRQHRVSAFSLQNGKERVSMDTIPPDHFLKMRPTEMRDLTQQERYQGYELRPMKNGIHILRFSQECLDMRRDAGIMIKALERLSREVVKCIGQAVSAVCRNALCDRLFEFSPYEIVQKGFWSDVITGGRNNDRLTREAMRWLKGIVLKIKRKPGTGFKPDPLRRVEISKSDGGVRVLSLPTVLDRTVAKSAVLVLGPMFEEIFLPASMGFRTDKERFDALADLQNSYPHSPGKIVLCADIRKAFDNVNHVALIRTLSRYIGCPRTMELLRRFIQRNEYARAGKGLAQGCPLSPLFLNILLHDTLDVPLQRLLGDQLTYVRYADDLCVFGFMDKREARTLIAEIQGLLTKAGLELHDTEPKTQIVDLAVQSAELTDGAMGVDGGLTVNAIDRYLGLGLRGTEDNRLEFFLPSSWRERFLDMLGNAEATIAHRELGGQIGGHNYIREVVINWLSAFAPAWSTAEVREEVAAEMVALCAHASAQCDLISAELIIEMMEESFALWERHA